ncbi:hypothetical protein BVRB_040060, partial [Beta vulgaris subsp. vulgaris]
VSPSPVIASDDVTPSPVIVSDDATEPSAFETLLEPTAVTKDVTGPLSADVTNTTATPSHTVTCPESPRPASSCNDVVVVTKNGLEPPVVPDDATDALVVTIDVTNAHVVTDAAMFESSVRESDGLSISITPSLYTDDFVKSPTEERTNSSESPRSDAAESSTTAAAQTGSPGSSNVNRPNAEKGTRPSKRR